MEKCFTKWLALQKKTLFFWSTGTHRCRFSRLLSSSEVSTALRPFYFSVHPDLFGQYPTERTVNENSLKQLNSYLELLQQKRPTRPATLTFYLRSQSPSYDNTVKGLFRTVKINLSHRDLRKTVHGILKTCNLPTAYVERIPEKSETTSPNEFKFDAVKFEQNDPMYGSYILKSKIKKAKETETLRSWLEENVTVAREKLAARKPVRTEIVRLQDTLRKSLGLKAILWDCGWNVTHFRGCLQSFQALVRNHPEIVGALQGRTLLFGNDTGVSLDGHIMLNSGEVRHNWLDLIKNLHKQDDALLRIPAFEKAVSRVLKDIKVVRRKFQPKVMAKHYENHLRRLMTSLGDYRGRTGYPRHWPNTLENYELVVETEAGPLMLSPTGQFIVPASCPGFLVVNFIDGNMEKAEELLVCYQHDKHIERDLCKQCEEVFQLEALQKDDNITPELMIECCTQLLKNVDVLVPVLKGVHLWVTNYYSVLSGGEMCIPWNWKL
ncbi:T-cell activation inhibitor, mitochondrial-like [Schistocerca serialis cubense]|uniref:T-cell activation inhibitor, mitochondrial-like n=1 Tax=Schistocerca serialis cubense TaxID=2023355 RepID=UPI00214F0FD2|nr:T-cell activation inhibitor, mitochondrial-like [Schistocerca serialis cubense]